MLHLGGGSILLHIRRIQMWKGLKLSVKAVIINGIILSSFNQYSLISDKLEQLIFYPNFFTTSQTWLIPCTFKNRLRIELSVLASCCLLVLNYSASIFIQKEMCTRKSWIKIICWTSSGSKISHLTCEFFISKRCYLRTVYRPYQDCCTQIYFCLPYFPSV